MKHSLHMQGWYRSIKGYHLVVVILALLSAWFLLFTPSPTASALTTVPTKMNFQGRLTDASGNTKPNGTYNMRLKLYTVSTAGSPVWSEDRLVSATQGVQVTNGLFSIQLGEITSLPASLFASGALYLEVELPTPASATSSSPVWTEGPMTPRNQMATSAYAYNAETLDGLDSAAFGQLGATQVWTGTNTFDADGYFQGSIFEAIVDGYIALDATNDLTVGAAGNSISLQGNTISLLTAAGSGTVSVGTADASATIFVLDTKNTTGDPTGTNGAMYYNSFSNKLRCYQNGAWTDCVGTGGGGITTIGSLDGGTANTTGATISGDTIYLQSASGTYSGLVNTTTQTFAGDKTFNGTLTVNDVSVAAGKSLTLNGGATGTRPASPTEGMIYYDTTTKQLLTYANGKWQADRTDAVIVAASNSSQASKDAADYVADGNGGGAGDGDQVQINAALTAGSGKKVILLAGTYVADATILIPNNTILTGVGQGTVLELADLDASDNLIENSDTTTGTGVIIRDLKLDGRSDLNTAGSQIGVAFAGLNRGVISGVLSTRFLTYGAYLSTVTDSVVENSTFQNNTFDNLSLGGTTNTVITGNKSVSAGRYGIVLGASSGDNIVTNNHISNSTAWGIYLTTSNNNEISGNRLLNNGAATDNNAVYLNASDSNIITENILSDTSATTTNYAINVSNSTSDNNYLADNTLGTGSINDIGTGTTYGGQINASGQLVNSSSGGTVSKLQPSSSSDLYQGQNSSGAALFKVTSTGAIQGTSLDTISATALALGGTNATAININQDTTVLAGKTLTIGTSSNGIILADTGLTLAGTARGTKTVTLVPEYQGATFRGDGTNNTGSLSSDLCSATTGGLGINTAVCATSNEEHNYYEWANTQATAQDYDIYVRYKLPADYSAGSMTNLKFFAQGTTASEAATLILYSGSTQCASTGDVITGATTWAEGTVASPLGACTPAAGAYVTFKITLSATQNNQARAGEISLTYRNSF